MPGSGFSIISTSVTFVSTSPQDTEKTVTVYPFAGKQPRDTVKIGIVNPSSQSALTVKVQDKWVDSGGSTRVGNYASFSVPAATTSAATVRVAVVEDWLTINGQLTISNDTVLSASTSVIPYVNIWQA